ncbi:MAG TPA: TMEM175 family protein [Chthoniobacterales bacterium]|nr:TMEM175 family protein [Chthoniobacterales bacterium]
MLFRRDHEISRLEAFSDAVFAFALTLLVVSLEVPKSYEALMNLMFGFPAFACCFGVLYWIWYEHNLFFRRYGLQDSYTVFLNGALLFVVMFYVYPLKFMFDSGFARFLPTGARNVKLMTLEQLSRASMTYGLGFVALFVMFGLLYLHAYRKRRELGLESLEVFNVKKYAGQQIVSAGVGVIVVLFAVGLPHRYAFLAPMTFILMWPAHYIFERRVGQKRKAFEQQLPATSTSSDAQA